jgi:hypothetical protein
MIVLPPDERQGDPSTSHEAKAACARRDMPINVKRVFFFMGFIAIANTYGWNTV